MNENLPFMELAWTYRHSSNSEVGLIWSDFISCWQKQSSLLCQSPLSLSFVISEHSYILYLLFFSFSVVLLLLISFLLSSLTLFSLHLQFLIVSLSLCPLLFLSVLNIRSVADLLILRTSFSLYSCNHQFSILISICKTIRT